MSSRLALAAIVPRGAVSRTQRRATARSTCRATIGVLVLAAVCAAPRVDATPTVPPDTVATDPNVPATREPPCTDTGAAATGLLVVVNEYLRVALFVSLDTAAKPSAVVPPGSTIVSSGLARVPCTVTATLSPLEQGSRVSPTERLSGVLRAGEVLALRWGIANRRCDEPSTYHLAVGATFAADVNTIQCLASVGETTTVVQGSAVLPLPPSSTRPTPTESTSTPTSANTTQSPPTNTTQSPPTTTGPVPTSADIGGTTPPTIDPAVPPSTDDPTIDTRATEAVRRCQKEVDTVLRAANLVFQPQQEMTVRRAHAVKAIVTRRLDAPPESVFGSAAAPVVAEQVTLPCRVTAELIGPSEFFVIGPPVPALPQLLTDAQDVTWIWSVEPLKEGSNSLTLKVSGLAADGTEATSIVQEKTILVIATDDGVPIVALIGGLGLVGLAGGIGWTFRRRGARPTASVLAAAPGLADSSVASAASATLFLSYSRQNTNRANQIVEDLESAGYPVWRDTEDIRGGASWRRAIVAGIRDAELIILLLSAESLSSTSVERELSVAQDNHKRILPVRIGSLPSEGIPDAFQYLLADTQYLDVADVRRAATAEMLLQAITSMIGPPPDATRHLEA